MEKPKRNSQGRPFFSLLFILLVFVLGFGLGLIALNFYQNAKAASALVTDAANATTCLPFVHDYPEPVVQEIVEEDSAVQSTATALSQSFALTPTQNAYSAGQGGGNGSLPNSGGSNNAAAATSVVNMQATPLSQPQQAPVGGTTNEVMVIPGTYTPQPSQTQIPMTEEAAYQNTLAPSTVSSQTVLTNPLSAGEIDDNDEWNVYLTYRQNFAESGMLYSPITDVDVYRRLLIRVVNEQDEGILGATVEIRNMAGTLLQTTCTYADGYTMFLPGAYPEAQQENVFRVHISKNGVSRDTDVTISNERFTNNFLSVSLNTEQALNKLDLLFLIDATGSMDDEIAAITNNILYISEQIDAFPDEIDVRYALVSFKDGYYPTQVWDFTSHVNLFQSQLATLYTAGGDGETLNDGLDRSVHQVHWRGGDTVKLVFMIGDEPPGVYSDHPTYSISMLDALYAGIKVHPIASSGLDLQGEYIFRQVAQSTMGSFIFLSYDNGTSTAVVGDAPAEGSVAEEPAGQYNVAVLHEIVLNLIREELGFETAE